MLVLGTSYAGLGSRRDRDSFIKKPSQTTLKILPDFLASVFVLCRDMSPEGSRRVAGRFAGISRGSVNLLYLYLLSPLLLPPSLHFRGFYGLRCRWCYVGFLVGGVIVLAVKVV